jgi:hypothetical protein
MGASTISIWQVWDTAFVTRGRLEMLLLEPDGSLYGPAFGTLSPSGEFSADASTTNAFYEGWASNRFVQTGTFYFLAWLVSDPTNYGPLVNVAYQQGTSSLQSLYGPGTYPRLTFQQSFFADPAPTNARLLGNYYSDIQVVATWNVAASGSVASLRVANPLQASPVSSLTPNQLRSLAGRLRGPFERSGSFGQTRRKELAAPFRLDVVRPQRSP